MTLDRSRPPWLWPRAAYLHVPFCAHHCGYCDFAVVTGQDQRIVLYLEALEAELAMLGVPQAVDTVFLGGGTPSYLNCRQLQQLLTSVRKWLPLEPGHEFSIEANPNSLDQVKVSVLAAHGVNRVSLGVQSFQPRVLAVLERDHRPEDVFRALEAARTRIENVSIDLIFGAPGQTLDDWQRDVEQALALAPTHISTYGLTYEKGTRLWKQRRQGDIRPLDEDTELAMYQWAMERLEAAGFEQYEISNFARAGFRCRHNAVYWANEAHWGFGLGAARYVETRREHNTRDLTAYLRRTLAGEPATVQQETLPPLERARETAALNLRRAGGIARRDFAIQTGLTLDAIVGASLSHHMDLGLLRDDDQGVRLTRKGRCVADAVIEQAVFASHAAR